MLSNNPLAPQALPSLGGIPLKVEVILTTSDEVQALRQQVSDLTLQLAQLQERYNRTEYLYRCETLINLHIVDYCKACGVPIPKRLFQRPYGT